MGVGVALLGEGLEVAVAVLVDVVDDPRLLGSPLGLFQVRLRTDMAVSTLNIANVPNKCERGSATGMRHVAYFVNEINVKMLLSNPLH